MCVVWVCASVTVRKMRYVGVCAVYLYENYNDYVIASLYNPPPLRCT